MQKVEHARKKLIDWRVFDYAQNPIGENLRQDQPRHRTMNQDLNEYWDGMRVLPYHDNDLAKGMGLLVALECQQVNGISNYDTIIQYFGTDKRFLEVGRRIGGAENSTVASIKSLEWACRDDYFEYAIKNKASVFSVRYPSLVYDFNRLATVFAHEIVPMQLFIRAKEEVFYSPAQVDAIGIR